MIFSTYTFIFMFLPITFLTYTILNKLKLYPVAKLWLVLASFYFYAQGSIKYLPLFVGCVFINYIIGTMIVQASGPYALRNKRILLALGLIQNIGLLGYYKYTDFFIKSYNTVSGEAIPLRNLILPIGISFFTFQLIAFLVDSYRGETKEYSVIDYLIFITFFPQLIVGPITHHKEIVPQFEDEKQSSFNKQSFMLGLFVFSIGCAKKILLADPLTAYAQQFFLNIADAGVFKTWLSVIAYTFSYYFDLSGYADMAIGLGLFFNIKLPQNFDSPYKARNFREYWRRWHITLSRFLSDYVFRSVYKKGAGSFMFYTAVMITFLVSGFWHGAGWRFILWGVINGILVCAAHFMTRHNLKLPFALAWFLTFVGIVGTRILFVSLSTSQAFDVMKKMFNFSEFKGFGVDKIFNSVVIFTAYNLYIIVVLVIAMCIAFFAKNTREITDKFTPNYKYAIWAAVLFVLSVFQMTAVSKFLYFQF
ncbi:MAG: MBOAT family protein [Clostridia bacterium]|nr:MBOAT family protein [Clostridia bacterium]